MAFPAWHKLFTRHMSSYFFDPFHLLVLAESSSQVGHGDTIGLRGGDDVEEIHRRRLRKASTPEDIKMNNFHSNTQSYIHLQGCCNRALWK
ncbi:hypothetical protein C1H46_006656 [Malus baccata]|uniref:Uncharacterized protein n=1 Tax=Malus baccata TaxID=106549 RepID=A0A540NAW1_MALBA|nr:hypothetical protein C1H46_006656 [Malus baccata]